VVKISERDENNGIENEKVVSFVFLNIGDE
jgi:hypothetical protein